MLFTCRSVCLCLFPHGSAWMLGIRNVDMQRGALALQCRTPTSPAVRDNGNEGVICFKSLWSSLLYRCVFADSQLKLDRLQALCFIQRWLVVVKRKAFICWIFVFYNLLFYLSMPMFSNCLVLSVCSSQRFFNLWKMMKKLYLIKQKVNIIW